MLSLARSRYKFAATLGFVLSHGFGALLGAMYNHKTPDLYPNNAHHRLGWVLTWIALVHFVSGQFINISRIMKRFGGLEKRLSGRQTLFPLSPEALEEQKYDSSVLLEHSRLSSDSNHGLEPYKESLSLAGASASSVSSLLVGPRSAYQAEDGGEHIDSDLSDRPRAFAFRKSWSAKRSHASSNILLQAQRSFFLVHTAVDRLLLILGFTALCTGIVTYGRFFVSLNNPSHPEK